MFGLEIVFCEISMKFEEIYLDILSGIDVSDSIILGNIRFLEDRRVKIVVGIEDRFDCLKLF